MSELSSTCPVCGSSRWYADYFPGGEDGERRVDRCDTCDWPPNYPVTVPEWKTIWEVRATLQPPGRRIEAVICAICRGRVTSGIYANGLAWHVGCLGGHANRQGGDVSYLSRDAAQELAATDRDALVVRFIETQCMAAAAISVAISVGGCEAEQSVMAKYEKNLADESAGRGQEQR